MSRRRRRFNSAADQAIKAERPDTEQMIMEMENLCGSSTYGGADAEQHWGLRLITVPINNTDDMQTWHSVFPP